MRRPVKKKHIVEADEKYGSVKVGKLINYTMERGKKAVAQGIIYDAFKEIERIEKRDPMIVFEEALQNVGPLMGTSISACRWCKLPNTN